MNKKPKEFRILVFAIEKKTIFVMKLQKSKKP